MASTIILLTEKGAAARRKLGKFAQAGDAYAGNPSKSALKQYLMQGFICEAIPVEDYGHSILCDQDGSTYKVGLDGRISGIAGDRYREAARDAQNKITAIRRV